MSFKEELEKILKPQFTDGKGVVYSKRLDATVESIINLVDKEQLRLKANDVYIGQLMQENDEMRQAIRTLIKYGELS